MRSILTSTQKKFLKLFAVEDYLTSAFYFTGGTALTQYYIPYRYSDDLDFFSGNEVNLEAIIVFLNTAKQELGYNSIDINTSFNRNLIFLKFPDYTLKTEFTYYPFPQIENPLIKNGIKVDSALDIAVNKLFTIYQNPRRRDYMDLYMIHKKYGYEVDDLVKKAKVKFDWHVDPLKLGTQLLKFRDLSDYPNLIAKLDEKSWQGYFREQAKALGDSFLF